MSELQNYAINYMLCSVCRQVSAGVPVSSDAPEPRGRRGSVVVPVPLYRAQPESFRRVSDSWRVCGSCSWRVYGS